MTETTRKSTTKTTKATPAAEKTPATKKTVGASAATSPSRRATTKKSSAPVVSPEDRSRMIAESAYYRAEQRGFCGDQCLQDWLDAEAEVEALISGRAQGNA